MSEVAVSVVVPLFNKEGQVAGSLRSVLGQARRDFEVIVVNDGSTDGSREIVTALRDRRIRVIDQENAGVAAARNRGIAAARAEIVAFCDADDDWEPDHLDVILRLARSYPEAAVFATGYSIGDREDVRRVNILRGLPAGFEEGYLDDYFRVAAGSDPPLHTSSVAARADALREVGLFPVGVRSGEDLLTWARLASRFRIAYQRRPTATFHAPSRVADRPGRAPAEPDVVGGELAALLARASGSSADGLAAYLALWHRMRGVIFLKLGDSRRGRSEFLRALIRGGMSLRLCALWGLCFVPRAGRVFEAIERGRNRRARAVR